MSHRHLTSTVLLVLLVATTSAEADPLGPAESGAGSSSSSRARASNKLNPAISFNGLLRAAWRKADTDDSSNAAPLAGPGTGIALEEAELILSASVDPYLKADATIAFEDAAEEGGEGFEIDLEEVYLTLVSLPRGFGLRAGKMFLPFGRHNLLHRHRYPFIQTALVNERLLGREALNEPAVEVSYLLPLPWFSQVIGVIGDGRNDELFEAAEPEDLMYMAHFKNLWDLSESATFELGGSALYGQRGSEGDAASRLYGLHTTYKYRPTRHSIYRSLELQGELMYRDRDAIDAEHDDDVATGGYVHARYQVARRWWLQARFGGVDYQDHGDENRWSFLVAFVPSPFSALRLEYATLDSVSGERDHQILTQLNFTIGSHPAHVY